MMCISKINEAVKRSKWHKEMMESAKQRADELLGTPIPVLKYSDWSIFFETGSRAEFEAKYFEHRGRLATYALTSMYYDNPEYLEELEDIIWAICDEHTWAIPAHLWGAPQIKEQRAWVDLFAAETGFALTEISHILNDRLSDITKERIKMEVQDRIIDAFLNRADQFHWESIVNNWAAVCAGSVGVAFMYQATKDEFDKALPRLLAAMDSFLSSFGDDGACREGAGYWTYGFGFFTYFAEMLRDHTRGEINLFANEKIRKIAKFQQIQMLRGNYVANFSDCGRQIGYRMGLTHFLAKEYSDVIIPPVQYASSIFNDHCYRWGHIIRDFTWYDPNNQTGEAIEKYEYLPDAQWYINTNKDFAFAAKGGDNNEPHNHNDVGSFIFMTNNNTAFCELGMGEYTHAYFKPDTRYTFLPNGSQGHSVPIIGGKTQQFGAEFKGVLIEQNDRKFSVDISKAYGIDSLKSLVRTFELDENGVTLSDSYSFIGEVPSIIERFISCVEPKIKKNIITIGDARVTFDPAILSCSVTATDYVSHKGRRNIPTYFVDFAVINAASEVSVSIRIDTDSK